MEEEQIIIMYELKDNFLSYDDFSNLSNLMLGSDFPWFYNDRKVEEYDGQYQFTHTFYRNDSISSECFMYLEPIMKKFKPVALLAVKANLTTKENKRTQSILHCDGENLWGVRDGEKGWLTSIFYMNTNNGCTIFDDGTKIKSVANRFVTFPCSTKHAGISCTDENIRVLINFNYII